VELAPTAKFKSKVKGTIAFKEVPGGVELTANLEGLNAGKQHAWHIHEKGDCSAPDATSAGAHFNPGKHDHGGPDSEKHHAGDFGNVTADKAGKATLTVVMKGVTIADGETSIVGKAFIVHAKADDLKSQPAGNAGDRIACGVIAK
jgi:Cu-Zn family superoxide dismutase